MPHYSIDGKLVFKTGVDRRVLSIPQLQEMGEDGILRWRKDRKSAQPRMIELDTAQIKAGRTTIELIE